MNTAGKVGLYALGLAVVFGGSLALGNVLGTSAPAPQASHAATHAPATPTASADHGDHGPAAATARHHTPGGLQVSENGYTFTPLTTIKAGEPTDFRFTITGPDGEPVTDYTVQHEKKLHLIVVSRDLVTFRHLHPEQTGDGGWSVKITLDDPGAYRAFADFAPAGGEGMTLGADLLVAGDHRPGPLPEPTRTAKVGDYTVTLEGDLVPGRERTLTLTVTKDGAPVTDLQPYLGAYGHLVALRAGDLAYLHVHPDGGPGDGKTPPGPEITFHTTVPSTGDYRLFLDFKHDGKVRTADFTVRAGSGRPRPTAEPHDHPSHGGHEH
ncbi:MAG: hypothetical protein DIU60_019680 [Actinomycetes bacterium]|jgi:hypothetical protein|nr:MAG: hypothetical protein DIU60_06560 [Actinomycetota bacterium]